MTYAPRHARYWMATSEGQTGYVGRHRTPEPIHETPHDDWDGRHGRIASCPPDLSVIDWRIDFVPTTATDAVPFGFIQTK